MLLSHYVTTLNLYQLVINLERGGGTCFDHANRNTLEVFRGTKYPMSLLLSISLSREYGLTACRLHRPLHFAVLQMLPPAKT